MLDRVSIPRDWADNVVPVHQVPEVLFDHQIDAMHLIRQEQNVFLGKIFITLRRDFGNC